MRRKLRILVAFFAFIALVLGYGLFEAQWTKTSYLTIAHPDIPEGFFNKKIIFASDFHCGLFFSRERAAKIVETINGLDPDVVILGGDYVDSSKEYIEPCFHELAKLKSKHGVYGVLGNHDYLVGEAETKTAMVSASIVVLDNDSKWLDIGGQRIKIGGVADFLTGHAVLEPAISDAKDGDFVVLAFHNPNYYDKISGNVDLALSGHTHGGQISLFGKWHPFFELRYGQKYISGIYKNKNSLLLVSSGLGTTILPFRFFARPEVNVITLESGVPN